MPTPLTNLREAHAHIYEYGDSLAALDCSSCASLDGLLTTIARARPDHTGWIRAFAVAPERWPDPAWPTHSQLHDAARGAPCYARSLDIHSLAASTEALRRAHVTRDTPDPESGVIVRDRAGEPTGRLLEHACGLVLDSVPQPTPEQRKQTVRLALDRFASLGFTQVHDMLSRGWLGPVCAALEREGALACAVVLHPLLEEAEGVLKASPAIVSGHVRIGGAKLFSDGALNSRTAWMLTDYTQPLPGLPRGMALHTPEQLRHAIRRCEAMGVPLVAHAIGDAAVRALLDAHEAEKPRVPGQRIEHAQFVDAADIPRFAQMGVIASVQPCHLLTDIEATRRLLPHREARAFPLRELYDAYALEGLDPADYLWFGSDAPVVPPDPRDNVQAAVHRRRADAPGVAALSPEQALTQSECVRCMRSRSLSPWGRGLG